MPEGGNGITQLPGAADEPRSPEEMYRHLVEDIQAVIFEVDRYSKITYISPSVRELTGYEPSDGIGRYFTEFVHPEDVPATLEAFRMAGTGNRVPHQTRLLTKSGEIRWVSWISNPILHGGRTVGYRGALTDITEQKRAEEALQKAHEELEMRVGERTGELRSANANLRRELARRKRTEEAARESEERLRSIVEAGFEGIVIHDNSMILDANPAFERMFGYPLSELAGKSLLDLAAPESRDVVIEMLRAPQGKPFETVGLKKDGTSFSTEVVGAEHAYEGRIVQATAVREITERTRAKEALQQTEDQLKAKVERQTPLGNGYGLTFRELQVVRLVTDGQSDKEVAMVLGLRRKTASKHVEHILAKMGCSSRAEVVAQVIREGLVD
ncbi:MAG: PAS domain S-box protein [Chloroflexi bacterium]|nr:PAS domain S-box protein [Chloroflexota bacterium]